jgi:hypothetical protein
MKIVIQSKYVKAGENVNKGDIVNIKDEGKYVDGKYGPQLEFQLELPDGAVKTYTPNTQTQLNLKKAFGEDSKEWIGKPLKAWIFEQIRKGETKLQLILTPEEWESATGTEPSTQSNDESKEEVDVKDIPF